MSVIFIATIGARDVMKNGEEIKSPRNDGKEILKNYDNEKDALDFPLIKPAIEYIKRHNKHIDRVILVSTDQDEERFKDKDTVYFAKIIEKFLKQRYKNFITEVNHHYIKKNPNYLDEMFNHFEKALKKNMFNPRDLEKVYTLTTGGIPALGNGLLFQAIQQYKEKCYPLYISEKTKNVIPLNIGNQLLDSIKNEIIKNHLLNYEYSSVLGLLKRNSISYSLCEYAKYRLYFDFESATRIIENAIKTKMKERNLLENFRNDVRIFLEKENDKEKRKMLIRELYFNLLIKYKREEYIDFLGRLFRFHEDFLRYIFEEETGISTGLENHNKFKEYIENKKELREYLKGQKYGGQPINYTEPNRIVLIFILKYFVNKYKKYENIIKITEKIDKLAGLRNKSAVAHGYESVSKEKIKEKYGNGDIFEDIKYICKELDIDVEDVPYERINHYIIDKL